MRGLGSHLAHRSGEFSSHMWNAYYRPSTVPSTGTSTRDQTDSALELNQDLVLRTSSLTLNPVLRPRPLLPLGLPVFYRAREPPDDSDCPTAQPWEARAGRCGRRGASPAFFYRDLSKQLLPWAFLSIKNLHLFNKQMNGPESICPACLSVQF